MKIGDTVVIKPISITTLIDMCSSMCTVGWTGEMERCVGYPLIVTDVEVGRFKAQGWWWPIALGVVPVENFQFRERLPNESDNNYKICKKVIQMEKIHASNRLSV